jgi:hypothetical protein
VSDLTLYKDKARTMPFTIEDIGDVEAGDTKLVEGWLSNNTDFDMIRIEYETLDPDLSVLGTPAKLGMQSAQLVTIKYSPSVRS